MDISVATIQQVILVRSGEGVRPHEEHCINFGSRSRTCVCYFVDVNQCMKFRTKTFMEPASAYEVITAAQQGSLLQTEVRGVVYGGRMPVGLFQETERETLREDRILATWAFLIFATGVGTLVGVAYWIRDRRRRDQLKYGDLKQSLL